MDTDKQALRLRARDLRRKLAEQAPDAAVEAAMAFHPDAAPPFATFSAYHPMGSEMDPRPLMARLIVAEKACALPAAASRDEALVFRAWGIGQPLVPDAFGIPSPVAEAAEVFPELVIAPVLAFDAKGARLGQGAGHYDRTLANLRARGSVFVLGLAYAGQEMDEIPVETHDQKLDAILTETGVRLFGDAPIR